MIWRVGRPPDFKDPDDRKALAALTRRAIALHGKPAVRGALHVNQTTLDRWAKRGGVSRANAEELAKLVGETLEHALGRAADRHSQTLRLGTSSAYSAAKIADGRTGVDMGLAALRERASEGKTYPNLAFFLELNDRRRPDRRRTWHLATIVAAAAGIAGDEDLAPEEWEQVLDRIERFGHELRGPESAPGPKRLTP